MFSIIVDCGTSDNAEDGVPRHNVLPLMGDINVRVGSK